jgi:drug/metabolite transporter (DMT)-like permease
LAPAIFVVLWSTGWISARAAAPHADPLTFLLVRFVLAALTLLAMIVVVRAPWPSSAMAWLHSIVAGVFINALYLAAVWWAVAQGVPAGISGVVAALQPILTAVLAPFLIGERISARQWTGIMLGFLGILVVLAPKLDGVGSGSLIGLHGALVINALGMVSVTLGVFYQKRFVPSGDLRTTTAIQYLGASLAILPLALALEPMRFTVNLQSVATMAWSVFALSIGAVALFMMMIREGAVSRAAALIYLVPAVTALQAWAMFGETLGTVQILGMGMTVVGVALAVRKN